MTFKSKLCTSSTLYNSTQFGFFSFFFFFSDSVTNENGYCPQEGSRVPQRAEAKSIISCSSPNHSLLLERLLSSPQTTF